MSNGTLRTTCCIVGGGPAGVMLGYLLARRGVNVTILEKHKDFFRDFRGDTVHPSTLELMYELGLLQEFLRVPHEELRSVRGVVGGFSFKATDFRYVPAHCKFIALMPQWDFLDFLSGQGKKFPGFNLLMEHEATDLVYNDGQVKGVAVQTSQGTREIAADLIVACDGRHSAMRQAAKLPLREFGVPIDVLWFRLTRRSGDPEQLLGNVNYGHVLILINRGDYFQAGLLIRKGALEDIKADGLEALRRSIVRTVPYLRDHVQELQSWDQIKLLTVQLNRLERWHRPGLLCIGDAAHAMSPVGGVGINLAIQDAVATANLLADALLERRLNEGLLSQVQCRREFPTRVTQAIQANAHKVLNLVLNRPGPVQVPWQLKAVVRVPGITHLMARVIGMGVRPEHISGARRKMGRAGRLEKIAVGIGVLAGFLGAWSLRNRTAGSH